jgi:hypothetical protein
VTAPTTSDYWETAQALNVFALVEALEPLDGGGALLGVVLIADLGDGLCRTMAENVALPLTAADLERVQEQRCEDHRGPMEIGDAIDMVLVVR